MAALLTATAFGAAALALTPAVAPTSPEPSDGTWIPAVRAASEETVLALRVDAAAHRARVQAASARSAQEAPEPVPARSHWDDLADCESGDWGGGGVPIAGTATWAYAQGYFEGGLQFDPRTWDSYRDADMPAHAGSATRAQQIAVAERVLADQGWRAWPVCSRKLGLR